MAKGASRRQAKALTRVNRQKLAMAAYLKAQGYSWLEAARKLGFKTAAPLSGLAERYKEQWLEYYLAALDEVLRQEVEPETITRLRGMTERADAEKGKDEPNDKLMKVGEAAGRTLLMHCGRLRSAKIELTQRKTVEEDADLMDEMKRSANEAAEEAVKRAKAPKIVDIREAG